MRGSAAVQMALLVAVMAVASSVHAEPQASDSVAVTLTNDTPSNMINIRIGSATVARLNAGASATVTTEKDSQPEGRFELKSWGLSLDNPDPKWREFHLRTAGFFLDVLKSGVPGNPASAANIQDLSEQPESVWRTWTGRSAAGDRLFAYAARYMPASAVLGLMDHLGAPQKIPPSEMKPRDFKVLGTTQSLIVSAIEIHGAQIIPELMARPGWARALAFQHPKLALVFKDRYEPVLAVLKARQDKAAQMAVRHTLTPSGSWSDDHMTLLAAALEKGNEAHAAVLALDLGILWGVHGAEPDADAIRLVCAGLDGGARRALKAGRRLAAQAWLQLGGSVCGDERPYRARAAEYLSQMGDAAFERHDLVNAIGWYRSAYWFSDNKAHAARLADTLAELALRSYQQGLVKEGGEAIDQARDIDPFRPKVLAVAEAKPQIDERARYGLMIIFVVVGFFAIRRLRRALGWSSPRTRPVRK